MYLGLDYNLALGRQADLLRWAEEQRKIKQMRSLQPPDAVLPELIALRVQPEVAGPFGVEGLEQPRAS